MLKILIILFGLIDNSTPDRSIIAMDRSTQEVKEAHLDSISVYVFLLDECIICHSYMPLVNKLSSQYAAHGIMFQGVFPNHASKYAGIELFKEKHQIKFPLKTDHYKRLAQKFNVKVTPEVVVYHHQKDEILYQGRIDNNFVQIGKRRRVVTSHELEDALEAIRLNKKIAIQRTESIGCFINFSEN